MNAADYYAEAYSLTKQIKVLADCLNDMWGKIMGQETDKDRESTDFLSIIFSEKADQLELLNDHFGEPETSQALAHEKGVGNIEKDKEVAFGKNG